MDGLLNTCHASLINIQSSPSRKCSVRPTLRRDDDDGDATGGRPFNIYRPSLPTPLAPSGPPMPTGRRGKGELPPPQSEFVMARDASRKILEYDDARTDRRLAMGKRMDERTGGRRGESIPFLFFYLYFHARGIALSAELPTLGFQMQDVSSRSA